MTVKLEPRPALPIPRGLTIEEYLAFTDTRPCGEKWELIEGEPVLSPSPTDWHQMIVRNIITGLTTIESQTGAIWSVLPGVGTRVPVSPNSLPEPDVMVIDYTLGAAASRIADGAVVIFEVVSPGDRPQRLAWKKKAYESIANCRHYITVSQKRVEIVCHSRSDDWRPVRNNGLGAELGLPALGISVTIPLSLIYRKTPLGRV